MLGLGAGRDLLELAHQLVVDLQPSGGVENDGVEAVRARVGDGFGADRRGVVALAREYLHAHLLAEHAQLLARRGPAHVGGDEQRPLALLFQAARELRAGARLPGALQAEHHQHARPVLDRLERHTLTHQGDQLLVAGLREMVARADPELLAALLAGLEADDLAVAALAHLRQELAHDAQVHVGLEQRRPHLSERLGDVRVGELGDAAEAVARGLEASA